MKSNPILLSVLLFFVMAGCASPAATTPASTLPAGEPTVIAAGAGAAVVATTTVALSTPPVASPAATQTPAPAPTATVTPIMVTAIAALLTTPAAMPTLPATAPAIPISLGALAATLPAPAATLAPGPSSIEVPAHLPARTDLARGVQISFLGADRHADGSSTWRYRVERQEGARKLKLWGLQLPECVQVVTASPEGWERAQADDQPGVWGVSWETKGNFRSGEFSVTVSGAVAAGSTNVAVQSAQLAVGPITGPRCE